MHPRHLPSTFSGSVEPSVNFCQHIACRGTLQKRSVPPRIFHQLSVQSRDLPSTSVCLGTFCQLPSTFPVCKGPSVNFLCISGTFCQLPSTFRATQDLPPTCVDSMFVRRTFSRFPLTISASMGPFKNVLCTRWTFRQFQATFRADVGHSGNSQCGRRTFLQVASTFHAAVVPSATFHAVAGSSGNCPSSHGPSVNFHQLSVHQQEL